MSDSEEIKAKLNIVDVIREYVPLKAAGANFQALCPFHNEKTPSFIVSPDKQIWHCFGCGRGGDIFSFIMEKEGFDFIEALHFLAAKAGVELKNDNPQRRSQRNRLLDIMELSGKYYAHILNSSVGQKAKKYLLKRGLKEEIISSWQLGYSLDSWSSLYDFLRQHPKTGKKYTDEEITAAGLIIKKDNIFHGRQYYDRFRGRIMFPIWNVANNLIAFSARVSPDKEKTEKMGKYINSPQTKIYDKSKIFFALNKAKSAIKEQDLAIVVEGQMDAISCHNHGIENVVASSGTALSTDQIALIKRFSNNIALAFDMDKAGQNAVDRGIKEALAQGLNVKIITLPQGKDPDECLRYNPADFKEAVKAAEPMMEYYFKKISFDLNLEELDNKIKVRDKMFAMIALLNNKVDKGYWLKRMSEKLDFSETDIREEFVKITNRDFKKSIVYELSSEAKTVKDKLKPLSREEMLSELFLALIIKFSELFNYGLENLDPEQVHGQEKIELYKFLIIYHNKTAVFSYDDFRYHLSDKVELEKLLNRLILLGEKEFYSHSPEEARQELIKVILELKRHNYRKRIKALEKELSLLEKSADNEEEKIVEIMTEIKSLTEGLKKLI
jgi:DNA primase